MSLDEAARATSSATPRHSADSTDIEGGFNSLNNRNNGAIVQRRSIGDSHTLHAIEHGAAFDESTGSSDSSEAVDSWEYLMKLKLCKLVDVVTYLYRTFLPSSLWIAILAMRDQ